jgi:nucleotide-binding universal stress UspA family protein
MLTYIGAYDGTEASRAAVRFAVDLARAERAQVIAAHVYPEITPMYGRGGIRAADVALQEDARIAGQAILDGLDVEGISRRMLVCGAPARALHELAFAEDASLLSVGVTHHGHLGRLIPGSVGAKLLHGACCPVAAVPAGERTPIATIGVAYDGGEESRHALVTAERLARTLGARLVLIGALESPVYAGPAMATAWDLEPAAREAFESDLRDAAGRISDIEVETRVVPGPAGSMIAKLAHGWIDLLVAGSRSYGPRRAVLLGSVARHLVDHAQRPVLVVPRAAGTDIDREPAHAAATA